MWIYLWWSWNTNFIAHVRSLELWNCLHTLCYPNCARETRRRMSVARRCAASFAAGKSLLKQSIATYCHCHRIRSITVCFSQKSSRSTTRTRISWITWISRRITRCRARPISLSVWYRSVVTVTVTVIFYVELICLPLSKYKLFDTVIELKKISSM